MGWVGVIGAGMEGETFAPCSRVRRGLEWTF